jgi:hypothetical protein
VRARSSVHTEGKESIHHWEQCPAHNRCSTNIFWVHEFYKASWDSTLACLACCGHWQALNLTSVICLFILVGLGIELRACCLLDRRSSTWAFLTSCHGEGWCWRRVCCQGRVILRSMVSCL